MRIHINSSAFLCLHHYMREPIAYFDGWHSKGMNGSTINFSCMKVFFHLFYFITLCIQCSFPFESMTGTRWIFQGGKVCACCAYQDVSGMFTTEKTKQTNTEVHAQPTTPTTPKL